MAYKISEQMNVTGIAVTLIVLVGLALFVDVSAAKEFIAAAGVWAPLVFIALKALTVIIAPLSGSTLYPLVGVLFGFYPGFIYMIIGDFIGYTGSFMISRIFGRPFVEKMISANERGMLSNIVDHVGTVRGFLHMCMTCFALPELISYGAGLSKLRYWKFIIILLPASSVVSSILVYFGSYIADSERSVLLTLGALFVGATVMMSGIYFFFRSVKKKYKDRP